ncbi:hypothetical protein [Mycoplasmopsis sturni]|uniref:hypothetical protein n=1 Tax=Mycoplasmopsis sturni TaxID=39047 RepID=UPI000562AA84|nr:hypothetical protein [Mycoplasmopsis sturni]
MNELQKRVKELNIDNTNAEKTSSKNVKKLKKNISITLSEEALRKLDDINEAKGNIFSRSQLIEFIIKQY